MQVVLENINAEPEAAEAVEAPEPQVGFSVSLQGGGGYSFFDFRVRYKIICKNRCLDF